MHSLQLIAVHHNILFSVFSSSRKVFFTDYGQIPKVERCDMDGQNRTKLVDSKIVFPHGITLDLVSKLVYWADAYLDYIEVVDYEGKNRHTIIQGLLVRVKCHVHVLLWKPYTCAVWELFVWSHELDLRMSLPLTSSHMSFWNIT